MAGDLRIWIVLLCFAASACGGEDDDDNVLRLPLVDAPLDTVNVIQTAREPDTGVVATSTDVDLTRPGWLTTQLDGYPPPKELRYTRFDNPQFRYSLAYPDTLFHMVQPIGERRGMEFSTRDSTSRMLVYAIERSSQDDLEEQYQNALTEPDGRVTYRARESDWYIVSGTAKEHVFYEKSILSGGMLKTFRIEYPTDQRDYFDAVTAVMSASFD